ncbi:MAG: GAF domain-containing protein [Spirochaetales bacterium]|nr:GAF domain-containing protein [Spirochaetales bacterium]
MIKIKIWVRKIIETASLSLLIAAINLVFPNDPGFLSIYLLPYAVSAVFLSGYYGRRYGILSVSTSLLFILLPMPFIFDQFYHQITILAYWKTILNGSYIPIPITLALIYLFGTMKTGYNNSIVKYRKRLDELTKKTYQLNNIKEAQTSVIQELEERVSKQENSITNLYSKVEEMNTLDHRKILQVLLETVKSFTRTNKASIWTFDESTPDILNLEVTMGWSEDDRQYDTIPIQNTIEGWVFRNKRMFSVRMLLQHDNLSKICEDRNLITIPISINNRVWGILNIENMPFQKYNLYTEQLLSIIVNLSHSAIEDAIEYESLLKKEETDTDTGLPLFSQLYGFLEEKIKGPEGFRGYLSLIILEFANQDKIIAEHGPDAAGTILEELLTRMKKLTEGRAKCFRYKESNQFAYTFTDLDSDGVSMFCLDVLGSISEEGFTVSGKQTAVEVILGYSVAFEKTSNVDELLEEAEHLLEIQKV